MNIQSVESIRVVLLDDLVKVFSDEAPAPSLAEVDLSVLRNDRLSFQVAFSGVAPGDASEQFHTRYAKIGVESPLAGCVTLRTVGHVPCQYTALQSADDNYLRKAPGLYPDPLVPLPTGVVAVTNGRWNALWIDVEVPADCAAGEYPLVLSMDDPQTGERLVTVDLAITVLPFSLPEQVFPRTEWFHADCLAQFYGVPVFSEAHWNILRRFIAAAVKRGVNMILTPQFTPPLDTAVGWERPTVQLVDVYPEAGGYRFDFARLRRWIELCLDCGVRYFEMSHLFSQWGAVAAPKVVGIVDGEARRLFGWDTPATGGTYTDFLRQYLPELRKVLREYGVEDRTYFHISDEPHLSHLDSYRAAMESVRDVLDGCHFIEALSDYDFYRTGLVEHPVCATDHIGPFLEHATPGLWCYYCVSQSVDVSNCFIAQPSGRTRLYGAQLYKFDIEGSLRWGFNFYNSAFSYYPVNPFMVTDSGGALPSGDPFIVYPGPGGAPWESIRMMVLDDAIRDLRALRALEAKLGRAATVALMEDALGLALTFTTNPPHPEDARAVLRMRQRINAALCDGWEER